MLIRHLCFILISTPLLATGVRAQNWIWEEEPNDSKSESDRVDGMTQDDVLANYGQAGDRDVWRVRTRLAPAGIWEHRLEQTFGTNFPELRGRSQAGGVVDRGSDVTVQLAGADAVSPRFVKWYGFGKGEEVHYDLGAMVSQRSPYTAQLRTRPIIPTQVAQVFEPGTITISSLGAGHNSNTEIWVYDAQFNAIPGYGNDDKILLLQEQAELVRTYAPGTYYVAISDVGLANDLPSPPDDDRRSGDVLDFPDVLLNGSPATGVDVTFAIYDSVPNLAFVNAMKLEPFEVLWYRFEVGAGAAVQPVCEGDGNAGTCPCANEAARGTGRGCRNGTGRGGLLLAAGSNGVTADDLEIHGRELAPGQFGLLFAGSAVGSRTPLGDGLSCLSGSTSRLGLAPVDDLGFARWTALGAAAGWTAGDVLLLQAAYRDPAPGACATGFNFTGGLLLTVAP